MGLVLPEIFYANHMPRNNAICDYAQRGYIDVYPTATLQIAEVMQIPERRVCKGLNHRPWYPYQNEFPRTLKSGKWKRTHLLKDHKIGLEPTDCKLMENLQEKRNEHESRYGP